jgi:hypothetical protein
VRVERKEGNMTPDDAAPLSPRYWLAVHGAAWGVVWIVLAFGVPRVASIFADFGLPLSKLTADVLWASRRRVLSTTVVLALLAVDHVVLNRLARQGDAEVFRFWGQAVLAVAGIAIALILGAVVPPLLPLLSPQNLSG